MKRRYKEKPTFAEEILKENLKYPLLYYADSLYPEKLTLLRSSQFKIIIRKMARQLSPLLNLNTSQFFTILEKNLSIRTSLQSCLASFPRRCYSRFSDSRQKKQKLDNLKDESYLLYSFLMKIVLFIFYRISSAEDKYDKELIYNEFLLDIPKLLDIASIYGESNPQIVKKIISNAYKLHPSYDDDTVDFFNFVESGKFSQMERNRSTYIDFSPQSLSAENYGNRQKYMIEKAMLTVFTVKDILFNLTNFIRYFPKKYVYQLATDYKLQQKLVDGVTFFMDQIENEWNLGQYKQRYFSMHFEDLRQSMAIYFIEQFKILKEIINNESKQVKEFEQQAHNTYETFCLMLKFKHKPYHLQYVKLINNLIQQSEETIFFLKGKKVLNAINKTIVAVQYSQRYQKQYRNNHKIAGSVDFDPILKKNRENIKKFKETYIDPLDQKINELAKKREQEFKKNEDYALNSYISHLKYGGTSQEYDDEPEQQEFNAVELPNQYGKLEKVQQNLSFSISPKKKYVLKESVNKSQLNFSFKFANKKDNLSSLSFAQFKQLPQTQDSDLSMMFTKKQQVVFQDLDISKIEDNLDFENSIGLNRTDEFGKFFWDDEEAMQVNQFQDLLDKMNSKKDIPLQNLSFT